MRTLPSKRASKIFERIEKSDELKKKPKCFVLANGAEPHIDASFFYVTGFPCGLFERSFLIAKEGDGISVFTGPLEESIARENADGIEVVVESDEKRLYEKMKNSLGSNHNIVGINSAELTFESYCKIKSIFKNSKLVDVGDAIANARCVKDDVEIERIRKACDIASKIYKKIPSILRERMTENEVAAEMAYEMQKAGGTGLAFDSIVAFGKNSALPHYSAGQGRLHEGQFVLLDYGARYNRYCSDITRTLVFGKANEKQRRMYEVVKEALQVGKENCLTTKTGEEINSLVTDVINSTEFKGRFIHSTGHSIGLSVHDPGPGLSKRTKTNLEPGMVLTVEPGIYIPGFGGVRIEDDVLVTKDKPRVLTSATRELIEV